MCGRYSHSKEHKYDVYIGDYQVQIIFGRKFNIAPTHRVPVIIADGGKPVVKQFKWGLIPYWSKEPKMSFSMINAKAETLNAKPTWKRLLQKQRCLVVADGFYEWEGVLGKKMPWRFTLKGEKPFCFAGLWDRWSDPNQEPDTKRDGEVSDKSCFSSDAGKFRERPGEPGEAKAGRAHG